MGKKCSEKTRRTMWILCEAFTLTGDAFSNQTVRESLAPWCLPCESREVAMRELRQCMRERVIENYEGVYDADDDIGSDICDVIDGGKKLGRDMYEYRYSTDDREICWRVYPCEVML